MPTTTRAGSSRRRVLTPTEEDLTDPNGNATGTAGDGQTTYAYDRANRLTSVNYSDATPDVTFTYDNAGNRLSMADGSGTETRAYATGVRSRVLRSAIARRVASGDG